MAEQQNIDLSSLPPQALQSIAKQTEQELSILRSSIVQLRSAQGRFKQSRDSLDQVSSTPVGSEMLIPLTESLYVPGVARENEHVLVELGTGFFSEKSVPQAKEYFSRKIKYLEGRIKELTETFDQKKQLLQVTVQVLQSQQAAQTQSS
ncbi:hypothetical protein GEMRC1_012034 [Eukaryota sp. GEM-RC1]